MIVLQYDDARSGRHGNNFCRGGDAVADGSGQRHILRIGIDQAGRGFAGALILAGGEVLIDQPRAALARHRLPRRLDCRQGQRTVGRGVEVTNVAWQIEQRALRCQHET